jgi:hypothetical protein
MSLLPSELLPAGFVGSHGEVAWRRTDAVEAANALAELGVGILGGGAWQGWIPHAWRGPDRVYVWETMPEWQQETERGCRHARVYVRDRD